MKTIKASEFKAKCLKIMDEVSLTGEAVVITKNGKAVTKLVPYREPVGTLFPGRDTTMPAWKRWLGWSADPRGTVTVSGTAWGRLPARTRLASVITGSPV